MWKRGAGNPTLWDDNKGGMTAELLAATPDEPTIP